MSPSAWRGSALHQRGLDRSGVRTRSTPMSSTRTTALALIAQYGGDAETIAMLRAAEYAAMGDVQGLADWDAIIADIQRLDLEGPGAAALN